MPTSTDPTNAEALLATLLPAVQALSERVSDMAVAVGKLTVAVEGQQGASARIEEGFKAHLGLCHKDMGELFGLVNAMLQWKERHNGVEEVKAKVEADKKQDQHVEALNKPQWHQAWAIYSGLPIAFVALIIALVTYLTR